MNNIVKRVMGWREKKRLKRISDMSPNTAFTGMIASGFCGSFYALVVSKFYYDYIVATNETGIFNLYSIVTGIILASAALLAFCFGLFFQICNKVYIDKVFEEENKMD